MFESALSRGCLKQGVCREELTVLLAMLQAVLGAGCWVLHGKVSGI